MHHVKLLNAERVEGANMPRLGSHGPLQASTHPPGLLSEHGPSTVARG